MSLRDIIAPSHQRFLHDRKDGRQIDRTDGFMRKHGSTPKRKNITRHAVDPDGEQWKTLDHPGLNARQHRSLPPEVGPTWAHYVKASPPKAKVGEVPSMRSRFNPDCFVAYEPKPRKLGDLDLTALFGPRFMPTK